jgi:hypothetical protein
MTKEPINERDKRQLDLQLNRELLDTFPASDPLSITRFPRERRSAEKPRMRSDTASAPSDSSSKLRHQAPR